MHQPHEFQRRVLLCVTGLSPQIVTETFYALTQLQEPPFLPTEVHVITTSTGADHARLMLLDAQEGRFFELLDEYGVGASQVVFDEGHIHVPLNDAGEPLADIQTDEDNVIVADAISSLVRELASDEHCAIHASIAGGRKTMGFFLGYAMSLYGRLQDRLSHVLVNQPFESDHRFYYPPATPRRLIVAGNQPVHTSQARIQLAEIPFVRMRDGMPKRLQKGDASYRDTVSAIERAQRPPELVLNPQRFSIMASGIEIKIPRQQFVLYAWLADRASRRMPPVAWDDDMNADYLDFAARHWPEMSPVYAEVEQDLANWSGERADNLEARKKALQERKSRLLALLKGELGETLAQVYLIHPHKGDREGRSVEGWEIRLPASAIHWK